AGITVTVAARYFTFAPGSGVERHRPRLRRVLHERFASQRVGLRLSRCEQPRLHVRHDFSTTRCILFRETTDHVVSAKRSGDLLAKEGAETLTRNTAHYFAEEVALSVNVVGGHGARFPQGRLSGERVTDGLMIVDGAGPQRVCHDRESRAM